MIKHDLHIEPFFHAPTGTWSYVVACGTDAVVIDPVLDYDPASGRIDTHSAQALLQHVETRGLRIHRILETHAHADHPSAAAFLRARSGASLAIGSGIRAVQSHFADVFNIDSGDPSLANAFDELIEDGAIIRAGALQFVAMSLPGHTGDCLGYCIDGNVFIGDTLFAPDIGTARCDFPGGSIDQLFDSVQRLYALPDDTVLWLCHDYPPDGRSRRASITVAESKRDNKMLRADTSREEFSAARRSRDSGLPAPALLYPSLQINIRGGRLPAAEANGSRFLRTPLQLDAAADGL